METKQYDAAQEWIESMIHHMYQTGDVGELENAFEELAAIWDLRVPEHAAKIHGKTDYIPHSKKYDISKEVWNLGVAMMKEGGK